MKTETQTVLVKADGYDDAKREALAAGLAGIGVLVFTCPELKARWVSAVAAHQVLPETLN